VAIALFLRVAVQIGIAAYRICAGPTMDPVACANKIASVWNHLQSPSHSAAEVQAELNAGGVPEEGAWVVTDFTGTFELRRLQWRLSRAPGARIEDVDVMTFHFIKASGGTPGTYNDAVDLAAVETALNNYTTALKSDWHSFIHSDQYRWYKDGPAFYHAPDGGQPYYLPNGDNPAIRITEVDVAGTASSTSALPPQCAVTITEKTSARKHWGRWYIPVSNTGDTDNTGLLSSAPTFLSSSVAFYNACRAAQMVPVVFSIQKPERPKKPSGTLAAQPAIAYEVLALQCDNIVDIIRRRRYRNATSKTSTTLT